MINWTSRVEMMITLLLNNWRFEKFDICHIHRRRKLQGWKRMTNFATVDHRQLLANFCQASSARLHVIRLNYLSCFEKFHSHSCVHDCSLQVLRWNLVKLVVNLMCTQLIFLRQEFRQFLILFNWTSSKLKRDDHLYSSLPVYHQNIYNMYC